MKDKAFIDTNLLIYFVSNDEPKRSIAKDILIKKTENIISSQVIGEFVSVTRKKKIFLQKILFDLPMNLWTFFILY